MSSNYINLPVEGGSSGVSSLNGLTGALSLTSADHSVVITPSGLTIDLSASGGGSLTLNNVGSSPNAKGASSTGLALTLQPANASFPGVLLAADWTTFNNKQATVTIGALDAQAENANGLALVSNVLSAQSADATHPGMVSTAAQTFAGAKTFSSAPILSSLTPSTALILDGSRNVTTSANIPIASLGITIDGGGVAPSTGVKGYIYVPYACTINSVTLLADQSGSCVIDIWKVAYASFPPLVANTITASALPTLSSAQKSQDTTLTGWTTSIAAGDTLAFNVNSASTLTRVSLTLKVTKV